MQIERFQISGVVRIVPPVFRDDRGAFFETYSRRDHAAAFGEVEFVQDNQSHSARAGTIRGLHFQLPPAEQAKLVRVLKGSILDVAVDLRGRSPTFGQHVAVELSSHDRAQLFIPAGFAHGFCTLEDDTEVAYKVTSYYSRDHDRNVLWRDPALGIDWRVSPDQAVLSPKDACAPLLNEIARPFADWDDQR